MRGTVGDRRFGIRIRIGVGVRLRFRLGGRHCGQGQAEKGLCAEEILDQDAAAAAAAIADQKIVTLPGQAAATGGLPFVLVSDSDAGLGEQVVAVIQSSLAIGICDGGYGCNATSFQCVGIDEVDVLAARVRDRIVTDADVIKVVAGLAL